MSLAKYQVQAIRAEVENVFKQQEQEIKESESYGRALSELRDQHDVDDRINYLHQLSAEIDSLKQQIGVKEEEKDVILESFEQELNITLSRYRSDVEDHEKVVTNVLKSKALKKCGFEKPSAGKIENAIIVADLNNADDIIEAVMEKLN